MRRVCDYAEQWARDRTKPNDRTPYGFGRGIRIVLVGVTEAGFALLRGNAEFGQWRVAVQDLTLVRYF